jgi:diguanylate cyclase (GGDEF)-like protein
MKATSRRATLAVAALLAANPALALDPWRAVTQYRHDVWSTRDGLPQSSVEALAQTSDGYIWFGTQEGLVRYDGVRFRVFDKANTRSLRHNRVTALMADSSGGLWLGTEGGGVARLNQGEWMDVRLGALPGSRVRALVQDAAGTVWAATDKGLAAIRGQEQLVVVDSADAVVALAAGREGLWVAAHDGVCLVRNDIVGRPLEGVAAGEASALMEDSDGTLWIGTRHGLFVRAPGAAVATRVPARLPHSNVTALRRDRAGNLWIGTEQGGLARFARGEWSTYGVAQGLSNNQVMAILEDSEGSLWIGTQDGGVNRLADAPFVTWSKAEGLADDVVWPIFGDAQGNIWIGTKAGGLSRFRDGVGVVQGFSTKDGLSSNSVQSIAQDASGALWIGTRGGGLNRYAGGRFQVWSTAQGLPSPSVSAVLASPRGGLWIGTRGGGLSRFQNGVFTTWGAAEGFPDQTVHSLHETRDGTLWVATNGGGLVRFKDGVFRVFNSKDGLSSDIVNVIHEDALGTLWVGTFGGGLNRMRGERFVSYTTSDGLYDDAIFSILEDGAGRLWMSSNKGVFRVDKSALDAFDRREITRLEPVSYGVEDGMKNREGNGANFPTAWRDARGRLWFSTIEGAAVIDADHLPPPPVPRSVLIEDVLVDGQATSLSRLRLPPSARSLTFRYAAPSFLAPQHLRFRYKLEGVDPGGVDAGTRREAFYSRLPAGSFRFHVAAAGEDGVWHEADSPVALTLEPRLTERPAFALACLLAAFAVILGADRLRTQRVKARQLKLEQLVEERTRALAEANARLELLSSLDSLTGVANRRTFDEALETEWRRAGRVGTPISVVMLDLDWFKDFNDRHGHIAGDERLRLVARALAATLGRAGDLLARYGGEEFVALLPGTGAIDAAAVADRLRASVEGLVPLTNLDAITLSAGVATLVPRDDWNSGDLVQAADDALYRAKREGRNRVVVANVA